MTKNYGQSLRDRIERTAIKPSAQRGRPKIESISQLEGSRSGAWAIAVFTEMHQLGGRRGSQAAAIAKVARTVPGYSRALKGAIELRVKQAVKRHPEARDFGRFIANNEMIAAELERRMRGFPDDIRKFFRPYSVIAVLRFFREKGIDGQCPETLISEIRKPAD